MSFLHEGKGVGGGRIDSTGGSTVFTGSRKEECIAKDRNVNVSPTQSREVESSPISPCWYPGTVYRLNAVFLQCSYQSKQEVFLRALIRNHNRYRTGLTPCLGTTQLSGHCSGWERWMCRYWCVTRYCPFHCCTNVRAQLFVVSLSAVSRLCCCKKVEDGRTGGDVAHNASITSCVMLRSSSSLFSTHLLSPKFDVKYWSIHSLL